ncbi:CidA/LrgA family protein [Paraglaciecola arctica]|uniref:CidA/LrgA family protein n=1 Tax=Paraglaciecola arctica TaxID=1128911 RepID=UPI001C06FB3B|nr:CidA/LrgA family protein [Paraglaciecola arctica]MBU3004143.1 CidA/LrgA family protein [Paraglaciecola arctica]
MSKRYIIESVLAFFTLILFLFLGNRLSHYIALPAALLGLLLLFLGLLVLGRVPTALAKVSQFLLRHLSFFFIPPLIGAWFYAEQLGSKLWLFLLAIIVSTFISLCITSWLGLRLFKGANNTATQDDHQ